MADLLRIDYINSLPQPFLVEQLDGCKWPLIDICVDTGCLRFDVMGMCQPSHISDIKQFIDADGVIHSTDSFYSDYEDIQ
jgi:hypothetical protein